MKSIEQKIKQADMLLNSLATIKDPITHERRNRYYFVLAIFNKKRDALNKKLNLLQLSKQTEETKLNLFQEKRAIKEANVTSITYKRSQKILKKQIDARHNIK
jgi:hypothetical protein